ncbi:hypothetical protein [Streptomyces stelliscabiei]|uniref:Uncharacterized protein n=1 Tax=Streptomyces stelliscabiei TaxID=146820 RepID=A0A8I0P6R4_9ACTN|nr:hypothetical protein [Streptomyces stelliscabiei]MBE1597000.1 hypothetical protein [Streptomyces stelliscabiei]MDX2514030.1 hypothetical protein [Streptomyces stelliscabiei]MDX2557311.1 hypothetical protein [Streptomyces stelliscabiei]MDX2616943.1 hypothetical protein [Streptomyces stelliscabiei]MDX2641307.1 hypothetical protein [Streptomyces stelliscabiei]
MRQPHSPHGQAPDQRHCARPFAPPGHTGDHAPLRARQVCEAMDMETAPNNINNTRLELKRLTARGILVETERGLFAQPRP